MAFFHRAAFRAGDSLILVGTNSVVQVDSLRIRFLKRVPELPSKSTGTDRSMQVSKRCPVVMAFSSLFGRVVCCGN